MHLQIDATLHRVASIYVHRSQIPDQVLKAFPEQSIFDMETCFPEDIRYHKDLPPMFSGGGGLFSTAGDYLKFATMLLNKGRVGKKFLVSPKTIDLMTSNHLPTDLAGFCVKGLEMMIPPGVGFGLGFAVMLDPAKANILGTTGEYSWSGAAHTTFFIDPKEELIAILMTQFLPFGTYDTDRQFRTAVYQAIIG
jgi:CubicO group peptidase (beta-lactamase class C family)